jgi:hypothetical protein
MGLGSLFQKKTTYFDKKMEPQCGYCQFGKRTKDGGRILCEKQGLKEENSSCPKFIYSPLKRIPVKQLNIEGAVADEEMYIEVKEEEEPKTAPEAQKAATDTTAEAPSSSENAAAVTEEASGNDAATEE